MREYLFVAGLLIEREVEVEYGFFEELGQINFLSAWIDAYLYSLTITVSPFLTETVSDSFRDAYFLESGRLRMATRILGCSIF